MTRNVLLRTATFFSSVPPRHLRISSVRTNAVVHARRSTHCLVRQENHFIKVSEEVREAIETQRPVVALETTIYTHGG